METETVVSMQTEYYSESAIALRAPLFALPVPLIVTAWEGFPDGLLRALSEPHRVCVTIWHGHEPQATPVFPNTGVQADRWLSHLVSPS